MDLRKNTLIATLWMPAMLAAQVKDVTEKPAAEGGEADKNLVENGSFEEVEGKLKRLGSIEMAKGWKSPTGAPADLFTEAVAGAPITAPRNQFGDQSALTGINYAGLRWWSYQSKQPRTYLQTKLKKPLKKGQKYCVKFYVSLADLSKYSSAEIGAFLSKMAVQKKDEANLTYNAQVPALRTKVHDDMYSWQGVCGVYNAQGDEQYLLIGNFAAQEKTDTGKPKRPKGENRPQLMHAYYYIDDVSVEPIRSDGECTCEQLSKAESEYIYSKRTATAGALKPAQKADAMVFYFKRFQRTIDIAMEPWLNELVSHMKEDPAIRIRLTGHIDETEKDRMRMRPDLEELARERAEAVKEALVEAGIDAARITTAAKGADELADDTGTEVGMSKNRRVEVDLMR
jgi:outer membrane protein OmpA-like peptidoglycan-associated protein